MDFLQQTDLSKYLELHRSIPSYHIKLFLFQLLRGLAFCHDKKILHRWVENVYIDNSMCISAISNHKISSSTNAVNSSWPTLVSLARNQYRVERIATRLLPCGTGMCIRTFLQMKFFLQTTGCAARLDRLFDIVRHLGLRLYIIGNVQWHGTISRHKRYLRSIRAYI